MFTRSQILFAIKLFVRNIFALFPFKSEFLFSWMNRECALASKVAVLRV